MKTTSIYISIFLFIFFTDGYSAENKQQKPTMVFNLDYNDMLKIRKDLKKNNSEFKVAYSQIIAKADSLLNQEPFKVTDGDIPPTGDVHDFYCIGKYSFPNPNTPTGLPYIRKDGVVNPEARGYKYDLGRYEQTVSRVNTLALAWFYSGDEKYAAKASDFLRVWFIDTETRMNPSFECASALPGVHKGMAIGIIFGAQLVNFLDHVQLLTQSKSWTNVDNNGLKKWFNDYAQWLLTSKFGKEESRAINNHGTWYSAQIAAAAIYNNNTGLAKQMIDKGKIQLVEQLAMNTRDFPDGAMPHEMKRNQSFLYSLFGLEGFCALAGCGKAINYDLWHFTAENGANMKTSFDFLTPYLLEKQPWPYQSLEDPKNLMDRALHIVRLAAKEFKTCELIKTQKHLQQYTVNDPYKWLESKNYFR